MKSSLLARGLLVIVDKVERIDSLEALDKTGEELERALKDVLVGRKENRLEGSMSCVSPTIIPTRPSPRAGVC